MEGAPTPYSRGERSRASRSPVPGRTLRTGRPAWPQRLVLSASMRGAVCQHRLLAFVCCEQAAGEKYAVPEQGKMLGAEWKSLTDKDKAKYM